MNTLQPDFKESGFMILKDLEELSAMHQGKVKDYFKKTVFPMLTPMTYDTHHTFPILMNLVHAFAVETKLPKSKEKYKKLSFVQIPQNLPRFYEISTSEGIIFIRWKKSYVII